MACAEALGYVIVCMSIYECVRLMGLREDFVLCDYPVYAKENICHAFHSCVPRCMSV